MAMRDWIFPSIAAAVTVTIICMPFYFLIKEDTADDAATQRCGLFRGDIVRAVMGGPNGMVTGAYGGRVWVRFMSASERTNTHALGADGDIESNPFSLVEMQCFELEKATVVGDK